MTLIQKNYFNACYQNKKNRTNFDKKFLSVEYLAKNDAILFGLKIVFYLEELCDSEGLWKFIDKYWIPFSV